MKFDNLLFAHRGVHNNIDIPENSIKAFKQALKNNLNIELDIQLTKDNVLVVFHDSNLKRMTNIDKDLNELTYNKIKKLKLLNTNQTIPTLKEVLNIINGKVILDIENYRNRRKEKYETQKERKVSNHHFVLLIT